MRARLALALLAPCALAVSLAAPAASAGADACPAPTASACALWSLPALVPAAVSGDPDGVAALAGWAGIDPLAFPVVPLNVDDAMVPSTGSLSSLTAEQEALLGCGPFWGTSCERDGIDLTNAEASVLTQSWVGVGSGATFPVPPVRGPHLPGGVPQNPVWVAGSPSAGLVLPPGFGWQAGQQFASELAALSFNLQLLLVVFSQGGNPGAPDQFDPANPYAVYDPNDPSTFPDRGKCSFAQPQYCASVQAFLDIVNAPAPGANGIRTRLPTRRVDATRAAARAVRGCLPAAQGVAALSPPTSRGRGYTGKIGRRAGRCPAR